MRGWQFAGLLAGGGPRDCGGHLVRVSSGGPRTMAVYKSSVEVHDSANRPIGGGMTYVHVRLAGDVEQQVTGTVSLKRWEPSGEAPSWLALADGSRLPIEVSREVL